MDEIQRIPPALIQPPPPPQMVELPLEQWPELPPPAEALEQPPPKQPDPYLRQS